MRCKLLRFEDAGFSGRPRYSFCFLKRAGRASLPASRPGFSFTAQQGALA